MALKIYARHGGAAAASQDDITARVPFLDGVPGTPIVRMGMSVQNGGASQGELLVPDPTANDDASLYFPPFTQITLTEDATGDELMLAQGRLNNYQIGRAPGSEVEDAVEWSLTIDDANVDLRDLAFTENWVRPAENGTDRLYALALYTLNGISSTRPNHGGVITYRPSTTIVISSSHLAPDTNTTLMPAKTYVIGTQPQDVVNDCASTEGKHYGVVPHHVAGASHLCMLYVKESDHSTYASTVKISDQLADWDPDDLTAPVFEPIWDQGKGQIVDGNANISGLVSRYGTNDQVVISVNATLGDDNEYRIATYQDGDSVNATQAANRAASIIAYRSPFQETDRVSIEMLPEQHALITAGMSTQIKAAPVAAGTISTLGTYVDRRIVSLVWEPRSNGKLHAILELNRPAGKGVPVGSSQPKSTTPKGGGTISPCPCIETFTRTVAANSLGISEFNGNYWVIDDSLAGTGYSVTVDGSSAVIMPGGPGDPGTLSASVPINATYRSRFELLFKARVTTPNPSNFQKLAVGIMHGAVQGTGASTVEAASIQIRQQSSGTDNYLLGTIVFHQEGETGLLASSETGLLTYTIPGDTGDWLLCRLLVDGNTASAKLWRESTSEPDWGMTFDQFPVQDYDTDSSLNDRVIVSAASGDADDSYWEIDYIYVIAGMWCCAPSPGQFVTEQVVGYGNGSDTVYYVPSGAYSSGSLRVWVDGLEQTGAATETDPSTGSFTLSFTPVTGETIVAAWQAA